MQIRFQDRSGNLRNEPPGSPVLEVVVSFDALYGTGARNVTFKRKYVAMVDTGAETCCIDPSVLIDNDLPLHGVATVSSVTGTEASNHHVGHLLFPQIGHLFETDFVTAPLRANGRMYDVIIGMPIIRLGTLVLDAARQDFRLDFKQKPA